MTGCERIWPEFEGVPKALRLSYENRSTWPIKVFLSQSFSLQGWPDHLFGYRGWSGCLIWRCRIVATVDRERVNWSPICAKRFTVFVQRYYSCNRFQWMFTPWGFRNWKHDYDWSCGGWGVQSWSCAKIFLCAQLTELYGDFFYPICTRIASDSCPTVFSSWLYVVHFLQQWIDWFHE